ncbi:MAG: PaaI family thioesterase [Desulfobacteraceae bacterium]|nr:PaaI family thioesterase [Desulfobacteraceae bacterium]
MEASELGNTWTKLENIEPHCFACGFDNKHGLNMKFEKNGKKLRSIVEVPSRLRGWSNLVHGGIISTMIDETMSWSVLHLLGKLFLTKSIKVNFKKPLTINTPLITSGYIVEQKSDRAVTMAADICDENGGLYASGQGEFVLFTPEQFTELGVIDKKQIKRMTDAYEWFNN